MMKTWMWSLCATALLSGMALAQEAGKVGFRPGKDLDAVLAEAKSSGKPILVFMHQPN